MNSIRSASRKKPYVDPHVYARERLKGVEKFSFAALDNEGTLLQVGETYDPWEPQEIDQAMERLESLAIDPAKGPKLQLGGVEEAVVALQAENLEIFEHLSRESTGGAEFVDEHGVEWDVKSPLSPPPGQHWEFSPSHQLEKVRHDFAQGDKVLFNLTRVNEADRDKTLKLFKEELTTDERGMLLILTDAPKLGHSAEKRAAA
jgi:hypothetical protein